MTPDSNYLIRYLNYSIIKIEVVRTLGKLVSNGRIVSVQLSQLSHNYPAYAVPAAGEWDTHRTDTVDTNRFQLYIKLRNITTKIFF